MSDISLVKIFSLGSAKKEDHCKKVIFLRFCLLIK